MDQQAARVVGHALSTGADQPAAGELGTLTLTVPPEVRGFWLEQSMYPLLSQAFSHFSRLVLYRGLKDPG